MLGFGAQFASALWSGPLSVRRMRWRSFAWMTFYLALAAALSWFVAKELVEHRNDLQRLLVAYLLPEDWHAVGDQLIERFLKAQRHAVLINAAIGGSLITVQILLFPVKEQLSASFERDAGLLPEKGKGHPLWFEAWEEIKLFLAFVAAQGTIFWLGYSRDPARQALAQVLSYVFLFASFGIDFISPVLQRHGQRYSTMLKTLASNPLLLLAFGAFFTMPGVLVGLWVKAHPALAFERAVALLFAANVVAVAWGAVAGTYCGAQLLPMAQRTSRAAWPTRLLAWGVLVGLLAWNSYRFGVVGLALHHKSQILKCDYSLDFGSIGFDRPSLSGLIDGFASDSVEVGVHFDVTVSNPTSVDVEIEKNRIEIIHDGKRLATTRLPMMRVPAGGKVTQRMSFPLRLAPSMLAEGRSLFSAKGWGLTLYLEVAPGFEFPIYLVEPTKS